MYRRSLVFTALLMFAASSAEAGYIRIRVTNTQPVGGIFLTPIVVGVHDGSFDLFNPGEAASSALERIAEDGTVGPLLNDIRATGGVAAVLGNGPIAPGQSFLVDLKVDPTIQRFLTFASMVIPSNDAFIGLPNPTAFPLFDVNGQVIPQTLNIFGTQVWDAGTEVNDEIPANTAFLGQTMPYTGTPENGVVRLHEGFQGSFALGGARGNILNDPRFPNGDFTLPGATIASISIESTPTPAPASAVLIGIGSLGLMAMRRFRRKAESVA